MRPAVAAVVVVTLVGGAVGALGSTGAHLAQAGDLAGARPRAETGLQIQNLRADQPVQISANFYERCDGCAVRQLAIGRVEPGAAGNIYLPAEDLPDGDYSALIESDGPIATIARLEWPERRSAALYGNPRTATHVTLPLVVADYFGQNSYVTAQNMDPRGEPNWITMQFYRTGSAEPVAEETFRVEGGRSVELGEAWLRDRLGEDFLGSMLAFADAPIAVQSFVWFGRRDSGTRPTATYAFEGVPTEEASRRLLVPLFRHDFDGTTGISVVNPNDSGVTVNVAFKGTLGSCAGRVFTQGGNIKPRSSVVFYQGGDTPGTGPNPIPIDCAGSATIVAGQPVLAIVNDAYGNPAQPHFLGRLQRLELGTGGL